MRRTGGSVLIESVFEIPEESRISDDSDASKASSSVDTSGDATSRCRQKKGSRAMELFAPFLRTKLWISPPNIFETADCLNLDTSVTTTAALFLPPTALHSSATFNLFGSVSSSASSGAAASNSECKVSNRKHKNSCMSSCQSLAIGLNF